MLPCLLHPSVLVWFVLFLHPSHYAPLPQLCFYQFAYNLTPVNNHNGMNFRIFHNTMSTGLRAITFFVLSTLFRAPLKSIGHRSFHLPFEFCLFQKHTP